MKLSIEIQTTNLDVSKRDGSSVTVDLAQIPAAMFAEFALDGVAEYIRDSSASALINAYRDANGGKDGTVESRKAWAESNATAIAAKSARLMTEAVTRLYAGERRTRVASESDPLDQYRITVLRTVMRTPNGAKLKAAYDAIGSDEQPARRAFLLDIAAKNADWVDPLAEKARKDAAAKTKAAKEAAESIAL